MYYFMSSKHVLICGSMFDWELVQFSQWKVTESVYFIDASRNIDL